MKLDARERQLAKDVRDGARFFCHDGKRRCVLLVQSAVSGPAYIVRWTDGSHGRVFTR
jgi:hypothetical protein